MKAIDIAPLDFDIIQMAWERLQSSREAVNVHVAAMTKHQDIVNAFLAQLTAKYGITLEDYDLNLNTKKFEPKNVSQNS